MLESLSHPAGISRVSLLIIAMYGLVVLLVGLGSARVLTRHEVLAAQPAREMLRGPHWVIPTFAGEPRVVKPPATGWTIAAFMRLFGSEHEFVVRLPAALAGVFTGMFIATITGLWLGDRIGLIAGLVQLTTYYLQMQARLAEADMLMAACVTGALACFARACAPPARPQRGLAIAFYFLAGMSFLYKGGIVFVAVTVITYLAWQRDRQALRFLWSPIGIVLLCVLLFAWPVAAMIEYPPIVDVWVQETFGRATGELGADEPWHFYLWTVPWIILPWTPFTVAGVVSMARAGMLRQASGRFLISWFVPGLILLSLSAWKHKHYLIPIMPALTVPTALGLALWLRAVSRRARPRTLMNAFIIATVSVTGIFLTLRSARPGAVEIAAVIGLFMAGGLTCIYLAHRRAVTGYLIALFATAGAVAIAINVFVLPYYDGYRPSVELARRASALAAVGETIYFVALPELHTAYYLPFPMKRIDDARIPQSVERLVGLAPRSIADELAKSGTVKVLASHTRGVLSEDNHDAVVVFLWQRNRGAS